MAYEDEYVTTREAAELLKIVRQRVQQLMSAGELEPVRRSRAGHVFARKDVEALDRRGWIGRKQREVNTRA